MENKIIVAGAGHGGIVAAYYLAKNGYDVTVYEKDKEGQLGHDQGDSIHLDGFEKSGIPIPEAYNVKRTPIAFCLPGSSLEPMVQGDSGEAYNVEIDRHALYEHLLSFAVEAGVKFVYECEIYSPIVIASRVIGIKTSLGDFYASLVIDACGLYSPIRMNLPDFMGIQKELNKYDIMKAYRAYFNKVEGEDDPEHRYKVSLLLDHFCGISWLVTNEDNIDILIGSFKDVTQEDIDRYIELYKKENPHLGDTLVRGGKVLEIPVRHTLSVMVADGYAAVGDSAFMTLPVKGSGIGFSMRAGKILADCVMDDKDGLYTKETLWNYQKNYYEEIGSTANMLAVVKNAFPMLKYDDVFYAFDKKIISSEDLEMFGNEDGVLKVITSIKLGSLKDKAKNVIGHSDLRKVLLSIMRNAARYMVIDKSFPKKYDNAAIKKWAGIYDNFFESIKYKED